MSGFMAWQTSFTFTVLKKIAIKVIGDWFETNLRVKLWQSFHYHFNSY